MFPYIEYSERSGPMWCGEVFALPAVAICIKEISVIIDVNIMKIPFPLYIQVPWHTISSSIGSGAINSDIWK